MASSPKAPAVDPIDARLVRRLADILTETGLSEIEVEHSGLKIRVAKTPPPRHADDARRADGRCSSPGCGRGRRIERLRRGRRAGPRRRRRGQVADGGQRLSAAGTGAPPFVLVGDTRRGGQTLMIIEAMKTMNPIPAPKAGRISRSWWRTASPWSSASRSRSSAKLMFDKILIANRGEIAFACTARARRWHFHRRRALRGG